MPKDFFTDISLSPEMALSYSLPDLLIESGTQLIQFAYNTQTQKYESQTTVNLEETPSPLIIKGLAVVSQPGDCPDGDALRVAEELVQ